MAKYVLVAFDDDKDADKFVEFVHNVSSVIIGFAGDKEELDAAVRGVWKKPTKFCECTGGRAGFTRGRKYGWWVCATCKRPTEGWANGDHWQLSLGVNLLPISEAAPEYRGPGHVTHEGYEPKAIWCQQCGRFKFKAAPGTVCSEHDEPVQLTFSPMHLEKMKEKNNG